MKNKELFSTKIDNLNQSNNFYLHAKSVTRVNEVCAHSTEGYTEIIFALFDLLGYQFAPRLRDLGDQQSYRIDGIGTTDQVRCLLTGELKAARFLNHWDNLLRVAGSLKLGWVTASLLIGKLHAMPKQNTLVKSLQEYGRLIKTNFILRYLSSEEYRRRINQQLNKCEALHALRRYLFVANDVPPFVRCLKLKPRRRNRRASLRNHSGEIAADGKFYQIA